MKPAWQTDNVTLYHVCVRLERRSIGIELNPEYVKLIRKRIKRELAQSKLPFAALDRAVQLEIA